MLCTMCHFHYDITIEKRKKQANSLKGKKHTEEHKKKISQSMKGKNKGSLNGMWKGGKYES